MAHDVNQCGTDVAAQVRSALIERISAERYDLWIPSNTTWNWHGGALQLCFASEFSLQLASKMLKRELASAAASVVGNPVELVLDVDEDLPQDSSLVEASVVQPLGSDACSSGGDKPNSQAVDSSDHSSHRNAMQCAVNGANNLQDEPPCHVADVWSRFVPGASNQLAWTTACMISDKPGSLTPVLLHGPSGCGKSHLATAIAHRLRASRRLRRVVQMTSEQFTNDFTEGLRGGGLPMFRRKYRDVEALVLEDVQFFFGKKSTLAEVKHTVDNLLRSGKQVVLTADRPLNDLGQLGSELLGRLRGGLSTPMQPLDVELRCKLLTRHLNAVDIPVDKELVAQLAERVCGDGRVISGIVHRLMAASHVCASKLTWDQCWNAIFDLVQATQPLVRLADIERAVCQMFGLESESLQSPSKARNVSQPRMLAMFLARKYTPAAYNEIGQYFGRRRHSTVISAEKTVQGWLHSNAGMQLGRGMTIRDAIRHVESQLHVG